ncbi:DNA polymerase III subunit delta [Desulfobulbus alkaliphilus]|uniref:DNA polymerase III subunit delta n=1 Tax=Desulfobulbus alkaliphilus TaxID=869814 RepID=UPI00196662A3|nr:DNA polymerase III subunit delta [Desulfobulbus alkaliphilus]MBM9536810.1 DNA polymerase III subunit delta [Desulfobulbus alkaliphilus]
MPVHTRETLPRLLDQPDSGGFQVYVLCGERYLCRNAVEQLENSLLQAGGTVHAIDGDQEDMAATLARLRSFSLLPGRQIYRVTDTRLFLSRQVAKNIWDRVTKAHTGGKTEQAARTLRTFLECGGLDPAAPDTDLEAMAAAEWQQHFGFAKPGDDLAWTKPILEDNRARAGATAKAAGADPGDLLLKTLDAGIPKANVLILVAEEIDKRKKLFKALKEQQVIIDLSVETGAGARAQKAQKAVLQDLLRQTLAEDNKTMAPGLAEILFERVGFHPVALVMEIRKVMLSIGDRRQISREDLDALVGRTRQEALFELTTAIGRRDLKEALALTERVRSNGIHPLAIVATLRNFVRGLLLFRALGERPELHFQPNMTPAAFQQVCLPRLKEGDLWQKELSGHPFALYMQFKTAAACPLTLLTGWMNLLLETELRLKGSPIAEAIVLQHLILAMLGPKTAKE